MAYVYKKFKLIIILTFPIFFLTYSNAEEEEIYLKAISDQIQVITKEIKNLHNQIGWLTLMLI